MLLQALFIKPEVLVYQRVIAPHAVSPNQLLGHLWNVVLISVAAENLSYIVVDRLRLGPLQSLAAAPAEPVPIAPAALGTHAATVM